jgi:hypothetical protein
LVLVLTFMGWLLSSDFLAWSMNRPDYRYFVKLLKLAAPHCVSSFGVRLDLHRGAPVFKFLLHQPVGPGLGD